MPLLAVALTLFGCSDDLSRCYKIQSEKYASISECRSHQQRMMMSQYALSADYPTVTAMCMDARKAASLGSEPQDFSGDWQ